ncbi:MAG TPA: hypothetical protein VD864_00140, partial [Nocardioides sp.]|nr:hypothetical protein [Nocardioides sp.]
MSIALELDDAAFKAQLAAIRAGLDGLPRHVRTQITNASRNANQQGGVIGGRLGEGISQGLTRASPLIVAGVVGALSAGAPAMIAASSALFAGIGIAAAAQNDEVRAAWAGLGDLIQDEAATIADPIVDTVARAADAVGAGFLRMQGDITRGVAAAAPQVDKLVDSLIGMAENAMPGMLRSVERADPVMAGLGSLLEQT